MEKCACSHLVTRIVAWGLAQNNIAFTHWILENSSTKVPGYEVETLYPVPEFWCEFWKKKVSDCVTFFLKSACLKLNRCAGFMQDVFLICGELARKQNLFVSMKKDWSRKSITFRQIQLYKEYWVLKEELVTSTLPFLKHKTWKLDLENFLFVHALK